jgi:hypothetical protein
VRGERSPIDASIRGRGSKRRHPRYLAGLDGQSSLIVTSSSPVSSSWLGLPRDFLDLAGRVAAAPEPRRDVGVARIGFLVAADAEVAWLAADGSDPEASDDAEAVAELVGTEVAAPGAEVAAAGAEVVAPGAEVAAAGAEVAAPGAEAAAAGAEAAATDPEAVAVVPGSTGASEATTRGAGLVTGSALVPTRGLNTWAWAVPAGSTRRLAVATRARPIDRPSQREARILVARWCHSAAQADLAI